MKTETETAAGVGMKPGPRLRRKRPASMPLKSTAAMPDASINGRQNSCDPHADLAAERPAREPVKTRRAMRDAQSSPNGRHRFPEPHVAGATATRPATVAVKSSITLPDAPSSLDTIIEDIRAHHRQRRFAMGIQQVLDRKLESYIRINHTEWNPDDDEKARAKANAQVAVLIKAARDGDGEPSVIAAVNMTDQARSFADAERKKHEKAMEQLAEQLHVASWVESISGFGMLGLATIVAETGNLSNYANVAKVWKRLGFAPYDGYAGSTWKRDSWRPRTLTAAEWTENPFSGRRYAMVHQVALWLKNKQWIGAAKTDDGVGKPNGPYGEIYARRRVRTAETHPDWSKGHAHMDALRVMMKQVLCDLWVKWNAK